MVAHGVSSDGRRGIVGMTIPFALATLAVVLRFVSRRSSNNIGLDDWCCLFAYISFVGLYVNSMAWISSGTLGWPLAEVGMDGLETFLKFAFASELLYTLVCPAVKLSFLLFYSRIFDTRPFRISLVAVVSAIMLWFFASFFATILQCQPVQAFWDVTKYHDLCIDGQKLLLGTSSTNIVLNLIVVIMPIPIVWQLDPSLAQKVILFAMLCLGLLITVFSILRTYYIAKIDRLNVTVSLQDAIVWTNVEPGMTLFCACLPSIPHLLARIHESTRSKRSRRFSVIESRASSHDETWRQSIFSRFTPEMIDAEKAQIPSVHETTDGQHAEIALPERIQNKGDTLPLTRYASKYRDVKRWSRLGVKASPKQFTILG